MLFLLCNFVLIRFTNLLVKHFFSQAVFDFYTPYILTGSYLLSSILLFFFIFRVFIARQNKELIELLHFRRPIAVDIVLSVVAPSLLLIGYAACNYFLKFEAEVNPAIKLLNHGVLGALWFVLIVVMLGPLTEEVLFRGLMYDGFSLSWGKPAAILGVSFLFSAAHLPKSLPIFIVLFLYSLVFIYLREKSGSLFCPIIGHLVINSSSLLLIKLLEYVYHIKYQF